MRRCFGLGTIFSICKKRIRGIFVVVLLSFIVCRIILIELCANDKILTVVNAVHFFSSILILFEFMQSMHWLYHQKPLCTLMLGRIMANRKGFCWLPLKHLHHFRFKKSARQSEGGVTQNASRELGTVGFLFMHDAKRLFTCVIFCVRRYASDGEDHTKIGSQKERKKKLPPPQRESALRPGKKNKI